MSDNKSFPNIPISHWHKLRFQMKRSIPGAITSNYVASVLGMSEASARANVIPSLRMIGLIDENDNTNQDMAKKFRDDSQYPQFCKEVLQSNYPQGVLDAFPDSDSDKSNIKTWFMNHSGVGSSAASRIASFYITLLEADPNFEIKASKIKKAAPKKTEKSTPKKNAATESNTKIQSIKEAEPAKPKNPSGFSNSSPSLNINVQIHISSDATPDQIEKIFESMSKHIYKNK